MAKKLVRVILLLAAMLMAVKLTATVPYNDSPTPEVLPTADSGEAGSDPVVYSNRIEAIK